MIPALKIAFENGRPVPLATVCNASDPPPEEAAEMPRSESEVLAQLLSFCVRDADPAAAGRKLFVLAFACHWPIPGVRTTTELAKALNLKRRRTAQLLSEIRAEIAGIR
jgi:hypothetical protein